MSKPEKEVTFSQTTGKIRANYRNQHCSSGPEIRDSVILEKKKKKKQKVLKKIQKPTNSRETTGQGRILESLTTQCCVATNGGLIKDGYKGLFFFFGPM